MITILVDTREQKPFFKTEAGIIANKFCLKVGDYSTPMLLNRYHIERKSLQDLYGTLIQNHPRWRREVLRAEDHGIKLVVVVEGTHDDFINKRFPKGKDRKATTTSLEKMIATIRRRYQLEIFFCKSREHAFRKTLNLLKNEEKNYARRTKGKETGRKSR